MPDHAAPAPVGTLELLGILEREVCISNILKAALERSPAVLDALAGHSAAREGLRVSTEEVFQTPAGRPRRADLVATWWEDDAPHALAVEHKLYAGEGEDQSDDYAAARRVFAGWATERFPHRSGHPASVRVVMLTLLGDPPRGADVAHVSHADLAPAMAAIAGDDAAARLAREWAGLVQAHRAASILDAGRPLAEAFLARQAQGLDPRYGRFQSLALLIERHGAGQLELHGTYRSSRSGRSWYGAHFAIAGTAPAWDRRLKVPRDPSTDWWLHFQLRLEASTNSALTLGVFCETLPYVSRKSFRGAGTQVQRAEYCATRDALAAGLKTITSAGSMPDRWRVRGTWCQLAGLVPAWNASDSVEAVAVLAAQAMCTLAGHGLRPLVARARAGDFVTQLPPIKFRKLQRPAENR